MNAHIVVGVTGGIAAYKTVNLVSLLKKQGASVDVIMTESALKFVTPLTFETISQNPVTTDLFSRERPWEVEHISLAKKADIFVVAPATANVIAKMAHGLADDMLSTTLLATKAPVLLAPAMNTVMWEAEITQSNLAALTKRGVSVIQPGSGLLACGDVGAGRMAEPEEIVDAIEKKLLQKHDLDGKRVLVTAGATREKLDPVRFISNPSTGKMGYALAKAAKNRGADVVLVSGPTSLAKPQGIEVVSIETTQDLYEAVLEKAGRMDVIIQAAAPSDYRFAKQSKEKIKKNGETILLEMVPNADVSEAVGKQKQDGQVLVGFAAETENLILNAQDKLLRKNLDMIVANNITEEGAGFACDTNIATLITKNAVFPCPKMSKAELANRILDAVVDVACRK